MEGEVMYGKYLWKGITIRMKEKESELETNVKKLVEKYNTCHAVEYITFIETELMQNYLSRHPELKNSTDIKMMMVEKYGEMWREMVCGYMCRKRYDCRIAEAYLPKNEEQRK